MFGMKPQNLKNGAEKNQRVGSVVILYESLGAREQAVRVCEKFAGLKVNWYSFEDLAVPPSKEEAAELAAEADVLALALTPSGDLPTPIKLWMENGLRRRG